MKYFIFLSLFLFNSCAHGPKLSVPIKSKVNDVSVTEEFRLPATLESSNNELDTNPRPQSWPQKWWRTLGSLVDEGAYSLTQVLFDSIDDLGVDIYKHDYYKFEVDVKREVFDNQDVLNTYTVIDHLKLKLEGRNLDLSAPNIAPNVTLGFSFGIGTSLDFMNIRQVSASKYSTLPSVEKEYDEYDIYKLSNKEIKELKRKEKKAQRKEAKRLKKIARKKSKCDEENNQDDPICVENVDNFSSDTGEVTPINNYDDASFFDPSFRPRISKMWNLVSFPFQLPLTLKQLAKLKNGELMSYAVSGFVELGPNIGFSFIPLENEGNLGLNAYYRLFLKGKFRITVLKESARFVRVKLSRIREWGHKWGVNGSADDYEAYEGFLLFEGKKLETNILKTDLGLIPFEFSAQKKYSKSFDVGYRYDLTTEEGQEAFKKSVFGSFGLSQEYDGRTKDGSDDVAVAKLFEKNAYGANRQTKYKFNLQLFERKNQKNVNSVVADLELPSGKHKVFRETKRIDKEWKTLWGAFEKLNYIYTISLDKTAYLQNKKNSFQLIIEANIEDSHTSGKEIQKYINQIETVLGNKDLLPDLPERLPKYIRYINSDDSEDVVLDDKTTKAKYRRSSFYYGYNINQEQLEKFIKTNPKLYWSLLEKAFGIEPGKWSTYWKRKKYRFTHLASSLANVPLYLANIHLRKGSNVEVANRIHSKWTELNKLYTAKDTNFDDIDEKVKLLSNIFYSKQYGHEMLKLILNTLSDEELDYFLVATNDSFGRISQRGRVTTNPEYLLNLTDENIGFERLAGGHKSNPDILIKNLSAEILDKDRVKFNFELDHDTKILYFKLFKANRLQKFTVLSELVYKNKDRFKKGKNSIVISRKSLNQLEYVLGKPLELGNYYNLTMSSTTDGNTWSKVASNRFHYIEPFVENENENEISREEKKVRREMDKFMNKQMRKFRRNYKKDVDARNIDASLIQEEVSYEFLQDV